MERMLLSKNADYLEGELSYSVNHRQSPPTHLSGNLLFWGQPLWFALLTGCQGFSPAGALEEWSLSVTLWLSGTAYILLISSPTQSWRERLEVMPWGLWRVDMAPAALWKLKEGNQGSTAAASVACCLLVLFDLFRNETDILMTSSLQFKAWKHFQCMEKECFRICSFGTKQVIFVALIFVIKTRCANSPLPNIHRHTPVNFVFSQENMARASLPQPYSKTTAIATVKCFRS